MSQINLQHPEFLNRDFFGKVIKHYTRCEEAEVREFVIQSGSNPGESFASDTLRAFINYTNGEDSKSIRVFVKMIPSKVEGDIDGKRMFATEMKMYGRTLIDINRLLLNAPDKIKLFPSLIYQSAEPAVLVLEDLTVEGFSIMRASPDDYETTKLIFKNLAVFHAASFYLIENGSDFTDYNYSVYHMPDSIQDAFFKHNLRIFKSLMEENAWPELNKAEYIVRVDEVLAKCTERGRRVLSPVPGGFNVLNHGDFVLRNMLFRKINGRIDVQFLDFQLSVFASPAVDIFMALYGCMTLKNRRTYRNEILLFYYETFVSSLKTFGYKKEPPTLLDLNVEMARNGALGAQLCICYLPYLLAEWSSIDSDLMYAVNDDTEQSKRKLYLSEKFSEVIVEEFQEFFYKGCI